MNHFQWERRETDGGFEYLADSFPMLRLTQNNELWEVRIANDHQTTVLQSSDDFNELDAAIKAGQVDPDFDQYVKLRWPEVVYPQDRLLATYLYFGWEFVDFGREGEANMVKGRDRGYVRGDGVFRTA